MVASAAVDATDLRRSGGSRAARSAAPLTLVVALVLAGCGKGSSPSSSTTTAAPPVASTNTEPIVIEPGQDGCDHRPGPTPARTRYTRPPALPAGAVLAALLLETSCGPIRITLDEALGARATRSVAALAADGFYDGLTFHRVVSEFVIQGGDPTGRGGGDPGYLVSAPPPTDYVYRVGDVAMAKTLDDPAGTAGSQFFIVSSPQAPQQLGSPALYAVIGHVTDEASLATVRRIDALAPPIVTGGEPVEPVYILRASLVP